eukprot:gene3581-4023_t
MPSPIRTLALGAVSYASALDNGAALTPPQGWSTWNKLKCKFDADALLNVADAMVSSGMVGAGYKHLNIDDCWPVKTHRNPDGTIIPDPAKFPNALVYAGMKNFSNELRAKGITLGIYTAHGYVTCQGYPGSLGYEKIDAVGAHPLACARALGCDPLQRQHGLAPTALGRGPCGAPHLQPARHDTYASWGVGLVKND